MLGDKDIHIDVMCDEVIHNSLEHTIEKYDKGATILFELPAENYFNANSTAVKYLLDSGYEGLYVSFQRPYKNIAHLFEKFGIDKDKIIIIDCATLNESENPADDNVCIDVDVSSEDANCIAQKIIKSLDSLKSKNRFVLIDSLTTFALYKNNSEITKLAEILINVRNKDDDENLLVLFNVVEELVKKKCIQDITLHIDEVINVLSCAEKYSQEIINHDLLT